MAVPIAVAASALSTLGADTGATRVGTFTQNFAVGDLVLLAAGRPGEGTTGYSAVDSKGNTYTVALQRKHAAQAPNGAWLMAVVTTPIVSGDTFTVTYPGGSYFSQRSAVALKVTGAPSASVIDVTDFEDSSGGANTAATSGAFSTTVADDLLVGLLLTNGVSASGTPGTWTELIDGANASGSVQIGKLDAPTAGSYTLTETLSAAAHWMMLTVAIKATSGATTDTAALGGGVGGAKPPGVAPVTIAQGGAVEAQLPPGAFIPTIPTGGATAGGFLLGTGTVQPNVAAIGGGAGGGISPGIRVPGTLAGATALGTVATAGGIATPVGATAQGSAATATTLAGATGGATVGSPGGELGMPAGLPGGQGASDTILPRATAAIGVGAGAGNAPTDTSRVADTATLAGATAQGIVVTVKTAAAVYGALQAASGPENAVPVNTAGAIGQGPPPTRVRSTGAIGGAQAGSLIPTDVANQRDTATLAGAVAGGQPGASAREPVTAAGAAAAGAPPANSQPDVVIFAGAAAGFLPPGVAIVGEISGGLARGFSQRTPHQGDWPTIPAGRVLTAAGGHVTN